MFIYVYQIYLHILKRILIYNLSCIPGKSKLNIETHAHFFLYIYLKYGIYAESGVLK